MPATQCHTVPGSASQSAMGERAVIIGGGRCYPRRCAMHSGPPPVAAHNPAPPAAHNAARFMNGQSRRDVTRRRTPAQGRQCCDDGRLPRTWRNGTGRRRRAQGRTDGRICATHALPPPAAPDLAQMRKMASPARGGAKWLEKC